jgi:hypothetical protein
LLAHHAIAQKDLESIEADYNDASTDLQNALQALRIFGITANEIEEAQRQGVAINPQLAVRSPISGMVVQKLVFSGAVDPCWRHDVFHDHQPFERLDSRAYL